MRDELTMLRETNKALTDLLHLQFKHVGRAWDGEKVCRDIVDIISPEMTEDEMQAAWTLIRFCKRVECGAKAAMAELRDSPARTTTEGYRDART